MLHIYFPAPQYLESVQPLLTGPEFERMTGLTNQFESSLGNRLQRYLKLKALWATNYVSVSRGDSQATPDKHPLGEAGDIQSTQSHLGVTKRLQRWSFLELSGRRGAAEG